MTDTYDFQAATADCESAEDFLDHFHVPYDRAVLQVYRLHILQRFHDYLSTGVKSGESAYVEYRRWAIRAYEDFVHSDAQTEKVFRVFQRAAGIATIPLTAIRRAGAAS